MKCIVVHTALIALCAIELPSVANEGDGTSGWSFGFAEADITPEPGEAMMAGYARARYASGALDRLRAQALAFRDGKGHTALLITADVIGFSRVSVDAMRHKLQAKHDVPASAVCFAASHTHWGPAINYQMNFHLGGLDVWYLDKLENTLLDLADKALSDLTTASISFGACETRIGMCRRKPNANGQFIMVPNPDGSYDEHTPILRITRAGSLQPGSPRQVVVVGHACHATSTGPVDKWSADYPGAMRDQLESDLEDCRAVFVMGCGGDAKVVRSKRGADENQYVFAATPEESRSAGVKLANAVAARIGDAELAKLEANLRTTLVRGTLSLQSAKPQAEIERMAFEGDSKNFNTWWARQSLAYPDDRREQQYEVQLWRLGELTMFAMEGEVCSDWGAIARNLATSDHAMVIAYANHVPGYIPTARIIREGGYEGDRSHMAYFLPAPFDPVMETELTDLLHKALETAPPRKD